MRATLVVALMLAIASPAIAQFKNGSQTTLLDLPRASPRQVVTERIGLTDVTIVYHRPQAKGRTVFGDIVAYDRVWRAGANDNTTIEFADPVTIEGHALAAGRYGLHMIPGKTEWTVIFSKNTTSWGSFTYDPREDALRVTVTPADGAFHEAMAFEFTDFAPDAAVIAMVWERVRVPFRVGVDTKAITVASLRHQLRHLPGFKGEAWFDAALYCLDNDFNYDEALGWVERAIQMDAATFDTLDLKSQILDRLDRHEEAAALEGRALEMASPQQLAGYGDRLLREKKVAAARALFRRLTAEHPDEWRYWYGLAKVQVAEGDRGAAKQSLERALGTAEQPGQKAGIRRLLERLAAGQGIG